MLLLSRGSRVRPHRRQPTRLLRPWDSPGKNTSGFWDENVEGITFFWLAGGEVGHFRNLHHQLSGSSQSGVCVLVVSL